MNLLPTLSEIPIRTVLPGGMGYAIGYLTRSPSPLTWAVICSLAGLADCIVFHFISKPIDDLQHRLRVYAVTTGIVQIINIVALRLIKEIDFKGTVFLSLFTLYNVYTPLKRANSSDSDRNFLALSANLDDIEG